MLEAMGVGGDGNMLSLVETGEDRYRGDEPSPPAPAYDCGYRIRIFKSARFSASLMRATTPRCASGCWITPSTDYFPHLCNLARDQRAVAFLEAVTTRVARLTPSFLVAGFVHGVLKFRQH